LENLFPKPDEKPSKDKALKFEEDPKIDKPAKSRNTFLKVFKSEPTV
jgi:hypothetical protein